MCPEVMRAGSPALRYPFHSILGSNAAKAQVLWVTVDPERDTPELLNNYVLAFNAKFLALRGTPAHTGQNRSFA